MATLKLKGCSFCTHTARPLSTVTCKAFRLLLLLGALLAGFAPAHAATINVAAVNVDTLNDDGSCSLREAITNINNGSDTYPDCNATIVPNAYGTSDTINIPAGTYTIAINGAADELLNVTGSFDILKSVSIVGAGANTTTINGGALDRVFFINGVITVSISGVTITNGLSGGGSGINSNVATLIVNNSTISNNTATSGATGGGGILTTTGGSLTVTNSTISGNSAGSWGGGIMAWGPAAVTNSTISGNSAGSHGGGVFRGASFGGASTFTNSTISANSAPNGGGIWNDGGGTVTLTNTIVANQTSGADCPGVTTNCAFRTIVIIESGAK